MVGVTTSSAAQYYLGKEVKPQLYDVENVKDYEVMPRVFLNS